MILLTILFLIVVALLAVSLYYNYKHAMIILNVEDTLEDCLDTIDARYESMSEILSRPLFFDSPEVRKVVEDIRTTRNSLHKIAYVLNTNFEEELELNNDDGNR
jgi:hypothetical protein